MPAGENPPAATSRRAARILVIRLSALGDIVQSMGPFAAIRQHHSDAHITLLTAPPYAGWLASSPYFDAVWRDARLPWWRACGWLAFARRLRMARFDRVYDLQTSGRSSRYRRLFAGVQPEWSGIAQGASHPDSNPERNHLHNIERQRGQLAAAGIALTPDGDIRWSVGDISRFGVTPPFMILAPGCSARRLEKRWPLERYQALARRAVQRGLSVCVVGTAIEQALAAAIMAATRGVGNTAAKTIDLTGRTDLGELTSLARAAELAIGNDTGPIHLAAMAGCRTIVLFAAASRPHLFAPRGRDVQVIQRGDLASLELEAVVEAAFHCG